MTAFWNKEVGKNKQRKHTKNLAKLWLGINTVSKQAKTLNSSELRRIFDYIATRKHNVRNRCLVLSSFLSGMRVGELANLRYSDVVNPDGTVKNEIRLTAEQTKGSEGRTVFVSEKLQKELEIYSRLYKTQGHKKFFYSQKSDSDGFTANTLTQLFHYLYKRVGIDGASSHSGRRTYATNIASKGVGIRVLQKLLGHKNIQTTSVYIYASDDMLRKAVELV